MYVYVCMCMYVCMYVCMYACWYVWGLEVGKGSGIVRVVCDDTKHLRSRQVYASTRRNGGDGAGCGTDGWLVKGDDGGTVRSLLSRCGTVRRPPRRTAVLYFAVRSVLRSTWVRLAGWIGYVCGGSGGKFRRPWTTGDVLLIKACELDDSVGCVDVFYDVWGTVREARDVWLLPTRHVLATCFVFFSSLESPPPWINSRAAVGKQRNLTLPTTKANERNLGTRRSYRGEGCQVNFARSCRLSIYSFAASHHE